MKMKIIFGRQDDGMTSKMKISTSKWKWRPFLDVKMTVWRQKWKFWYEMENKTWLCRREMYVLIFYVFFWYVLIKSSK